MNITQFWQPIATAPKDGTEIVLLGSLPSTPKKLRSTIGKWCDKEEDSPAWVKGWPWSSPGYSDEFLPTHWAPLP